MLRALTSLVVPPLCALCGEPCRYDDRICDYCERQVAKLCPSTTVLPGGLEVVSAARYEGIAAELVRKMKFSARLVLAEVAAERMLRAWGAARSAWFVSVPPAPARARSRGYDTAHILARLVAREAGCCSPVSVCLERDDGPRQVGRPRSLRTSDPPRIRLVNPRMGLPDDDLWLVDDVVTTGATLTACADVLREAGAANVRALTFARSEGCAERRSA